MCRANTDECWDYYASKTPKARKQHVCNECGRSIMPGETYRHDAGGYAGERPSTFRTCSHCGVAAGWLARECGGWVFGEIREEIEEHAEEYPHTRAELTRLSAAMRAGWTADGVLMPIPAVPDCTTHELHP